MHPPFFSFEFYPPKTEEGAANLRVVHRKLALLNPDFFFGHLRRRRIHPR